MAPIVKKKIVCLYTTKYIQKTCALYEMCYIERVLFRPLINSLLTFDQDMRDDSSENLFT